MESSWSGNSPRILSRVGVLERLRTQLIHGVWPPGHVLQEKTLALELHVSKTPVREALQYLTLIGMMKPYSRLGYVVAPVELKDMVEVFQYRLLLEVNLVGKLAALPSLPFLAPPAEPVPPLDSEMNFHHQLYGPLNQQRMGETLDVLIDQTSRAACFAALDHRLLTTIAGDHQAISEAVASRDSELARALMGVHLSHLRDSLLAKLRQQLREHENFI